VKRPSRASILDWVRRALGGRGLALLVGGAAALRPLAMPLAPFDATADLVTVFAIPAVLAAVLAAACGQARRRPAAALLWLVVALAQAAPLARYAGPNPVTADPSRPGRIRILLLNVHERNTRFDDIARLIAAERPDVVGLVEYGHSARAGLAATGIRDRFPHRRERPGGYRGLALWSRLEPSAFGGPATARPDGNPYLTMTFPFAGRERRLWLLHAPNPLLQPDRATPDLLATGERIGRSGGSNLVMGDLNRTDGSPHFAAFARVIGGRDSRLGFGPQPSWPSWSPYRIAIDHVFVPPDLAVVARRIGRDVGSDHLPVVIDLAAATASATSGRQASAGSTAPANRARSAARRNSSSRPAVSGP
jgi:endonuclease/exonuclease/phosphatase (EEP) superfamily protein YafD